MSQDPTMDEDDEHVVVDNEYYNFLNVRRDASETEISAAYKKMTRLYHPDKHLDPDKKKQAELMFAKLKKAHEVLSDPHRRAIYDCLGKKGLEEQGWQIVQRRKTPREIREEYEQLARDREMRRLQQATNPTSKFQMTINATDLFERYSYDEEFDDVIDGAFIPSFEVSEITFAQTIDCPISNSVNATLAGNVTTRNGSGHGSVGMSLKRVTSDKSWHEFDFGVGNGLNVGSKYYRKLPGRLFVNMSGSLQFTSKGLKPTFNVSLGNHLGKHTVGYLTYNTNWRVDENNDALALSEEQSGMSTMLVHDTERYHLMGSLQFGIPYTYLILSATRKFQDPDSRLKTALKLGTFGAIAEYGVEKRLTKHSTLGATMIVGVPVGITLRIKLSRAAQTYTFPLHLSDEIMLQPLFYGTVTPLLAWFAVQKLIIEPYEARKKEREKQRLKENSLAKVSEARLEASAAIDLMRERFSRIRLEEEAKNGLIIVHALYGKIFKDENDSSVLPDRIAELLTSESGELLDLPSEVIDVTIPMQCLVEDGGKISIYESGTKADLAGFYDPCPMEDSKHLLVRYSYQRTMHQVVVKDDEVLKMPKTTHRIRS